MWGIVYIHMANTSAAKKAMRVSARKRVVNVRRLRTMRSLMKEVVVAVP